jgi:hypothetical protein
MVQDDLPSHPPIARSYSPRRYGSDRCGIVLGENDTNNTSNGNGGYSDSSGEVQIFPPITRSYSPRRCGSDRNGIILGESDTNIISNEHGGYSDSSGEVQSFTPITRSYRRRRYGSDRYGIILGESDTNTSNGHGGYSDSSGEVSFQPITRSYSPRRSDSDRYGIILGESGTSITSNGHGGHSDSSEEVQSFLDTHRDDGRHIQDEVIDNSEEGNGETIRASTAEEFQNNGGNSREASLELRGRRVHAGNPGDYLDARGFEHLAETDKSITASC